MTNQEKKIYIALIQLRLSEEKLKQEISKKIKTESCEVC